MVVKLGLAAKNGFPRTTQLMEALDYVVRKAIDYGKPLAVNISFGNNYGDHTGSSLLENFINDIAAGNVLSASGAAMRGWEQSIQAER